MPTPIRRAAWALTSRIRGLNHVQRTYHQLRELTPISHDDKARLLPCVAESSSMGAARLSAAHQFSKWNKPPKTILLVQKHNDARTTKAMGHLLDYLKTSHPHLQILAENHTIKDHPSYSNLISIENDLSLLISHTELVFTLGGDGTVLHTSNLFGKGECPPVVCFSMGSLGFLLPFHIDQMRETIDMALGGGTLSVLNRMRLACTPLDERGQPLDLQSDSPPGSAGWQVMNEVTLHRGRYPHLTVVDAFFDDQHLTEAVADGLLLSTPTGSTAYSLSSGGPISHPETDAFLLTPIAPRSLSFRTVILPSRGVVKLQISPLARSPAELTLDGRELALLKPKESVVITKSEFPIPCIERPGGGSGWVKDINSLLQFNTGFVNKSLLGHNMS